MKYVRLYSDPDGVSHFEDVEVAADLADFAPPAPPLAVSGVLSATGIRFAVFPVGWRGDWHPAPRRQFQFFLGGVVGAEAGDGEIRRFGAGDAVLVEDTIGTGHRSWVEGDAEATMAVVHLPD